MIIKQKNMKNALTLVGVFLILQLLFTGCGSTQPIMSNGEYHEAGFFMGFFGGLLWPISLIFMGIGKIFPSISGDTALYFHHNSGFGYWLGYCIGLLPYLALLGAKKNNGKNKDNNSEIK